MQINNRKSILDDLSKYDILNNDEHNYIEITEWNNGEGYDIIIQTKSDRQMFSLTHGELEAINYLTKALCYND